MDFFPSELLVQIFNYCDNKEKSTLLCLSQDIYDKLHNHFDVA